MSPEEREAFKALSFDDQLLYVINREYDVREVAYLAPNSLQMSIVRILDQAVRYKQDQNHLVCRYEDLVGPLGGGTTDAQLNALQAIATYLNLTEVNTLHLSAIADQLYGNENDPFGNEQLGRLRSTFRNGQVGAWKAIFNEQHILAFQTKLGHYLPALGYDEW
jgi:hypothetical protein